MSQDLLIEIGVEELPASFIASALGAMPSVTTSLLEDARLGHGAIEASGTARRLAVFVEGVNNSQADFSATVHGPPSRVAYDAEGKLTRAGLGFAKKQNVDPEQLFVAETDKGPYLAARLAEKGRPAIEVLPSLVTRLVSQVPFPKSMRWGAGEVSFGRPIHWVVALYGTEVVPAECSGVRTGRHTRGHRFLAPREVEISAAADYYDSLLAAHVICRVDERTSQMGEALRSAAATAGGSLVEDEFLMAECAAMVEKPHVVPGQFEASFLDLPESVIVSVMRDHQRYFAVRGADDKLIAAYLNVANTANEPETIARGNDRVLRARLADARFFVDEDRKRTLSSRMAELDKVVFQHKLGSVGDKVRRLSLVAESIAMDDSERALARRAAQLCKNDLVTLIVGEFPELQGEMGAFYAKEQGEPLEVATAIEEHYRPRGSSDDLPQSAVASVLAVGDRADSLVGCFGIGLVPTGSADPFALRRAALGIIRIAQAGVIEVHLDALFAAAWDAYPAGVLGPREEVLTAVDAFVRARLRSHYVAEHRTDLVDACLGAWPGGSLRDLDRRVEAVSAFCKRPEYESLTTAFKRAFNIAKDGPGGEVDALLLKENAERELAESFLALRARVNGSVQAGDYDSALSALAGSLREPIDRFFDEVLVMHEDAALRTNRLRLLRSISDTLTGIAHFHQLST